MTHDATLKITTGSSSLGCVGIAMSARGLAALVLGRDAADVARALGEALPGSALRQDNAGLAPVLTQVLAAIERPDTRLDLPLDQRGTALELAVWDALRAIPRGETRSYGAIAKALPLPATAQEVGAACAANRLAVLVPCHRVVKADGAISGYRWGVHRKRRLLAREMAA